MLSTVLEQILLSEGNLMQAEKRFRETQAIEEKLSQRRNDGKLLYDGWRGSQDWRQWRTQQLERQGWQCDSCGKRMVFGEKIYLANGDFKLNPDHPTVEHILPKCYFSELTLDKQNLVMVCWNCNRRKGTCIAKASRLRYQQLKQKVKQSLHSP